MRLSFLWDKMVLLQVLEVISPCTSVNYINNWKGRLQSMEQVSFLPRLLEGGNEVT